MTIYHVRDYQGNLVPFDSNSAQRPCAVCGRALSDFGEIREVHPDIFVHSDTVNPDNFLNPKTTPTAALCEAAFLEQEHKMEQWLRDFPPERRADQRSDWYAYWRVPKMDRPAWVERGLETKRERKQQAAAAEKTRAALAEDEAERESMKTTVPIGPRKPKK